MANLQNSAWLHMRLLLILFGLSSSCTQAESAAPFNPPHLIDAAGSPVGEFFEIGASQLVMKIEGIYYAINVTSRGPSPDSLFYTGAHCTKEAFVGGGYLEPAFRNHPNGMQSHNAYVFEGKLYLRPAESQPKSIKVVSMSVDGGRGCTPYHGNAQIEGIPAGSGAMVYDFGKNPLPWRLE
jgi:hypothetical protein